MLPLLVSEIKRMQKYNETFVTKNIITKRNDFMNVIYLC